MPFMEMIGPVVQQLRTALEQISVRSTPLAQEALRALLQAHLDDNLVLVLGAGVSIERGLLSWQKLLQELLLKTIQASSDDTAPQSRVLAGLFQEIFQPNALVSARYLQNSFRKQHPNDPIAFLQTVRDTLYRGLDANKETALFTEIRKLCMAVGRQPNLKAIITYNYDDLLEEELKRRGNDLRFRSIYEPGVHPAADELPIYHPHGFLPRDGKLTESNRVVLSEDYYHEQYGDVYRWSNLVQIDQFQHGNCLFIGSSLTDPNLRRLLDIAKKLRGRDEIQHYCIRRRYPPEEVKSSLDHVLKDHPQIETDKIKAELDAKDALRYLVKLMETYDEEDSRSFGIGVVWVDEYSQAPDVLRKIREKDDSPLP
jgi:SIR2-like domain